MPYLVIALPNVNHVRKFSAFHFILPLETVFRKIIFKYFVSHAPLYVITTLIIIIGAKVSS